MKPIKECGFEIVECLLGKIFKHNKKEVHATKDWGRILIIAKKLTISGESKKNENISCPRI